MSYTCMILGFELHEELDDIVLSLDKIKKEKNKLNQDYMWRDLSNDAIKLRELMILLDDNNCLGTIETIIEHDEIANGLKSKIDAHDDATVKFMIDDLKKLYSAQLGYIVSKSNQNLENPYWNEKISYYKKRLGSK